MKYDLMKTFMIQTSATVVDAMEKIDGNGKQILFVVDVFDKLEGVVTDGDIRRWLIRTGDLQGKVKEFMNKTPKFIYSNEVHGAEDCMSRYEISALPVLNSENKVIDIIFRNQKPVMVKKEKDILNKVPVVIMAGGRGTRLYPYTQILPKPLIPIGDIPIMERIIDQFMDYGVIDFYATVNYKKEMIKLYFSERDHKYQLRYIDEESPLGTAGSLGLLPEGFTCPFIVTNCDILIHADYEEIYQYHMASHNVLTMVAALKNIMIPYGVIHTKENGAVVHLEEKPKLSYFVNTGMYILNPEALEYIPKDTFFHMTDLADVLLQAELKVGIYPISEDSFLDMGEFEEMHRMEKKLNLKSIIKE